MNMDVANITDDVIRRKKKQTKDFGETFKRKTQINQDKPHSDSHMQTLHFVKYKSEKPNNVFMDS